MSRKWRDSEDEYTLSNNVDRVGYDADTEQYVFQDTKTGQLLTNPSGQRYGRLQPASNRAPHRSAKPEHVYGEDNEDSWGSMLPSLETVGETLSSLLSPWAWGQTKSGVRAGRYVFCEGDTFEKVAKEFGTTAKVLKELNPGLNGNALKVGGVVCVPRFSSDGVEAVQGWKSLDRLEKEAKLDTKTT